MNKENSTAAPVPWAYELWKHMADEHGLILLESELHEIMLKCDHARELRKQLDRIEISLRIFAAFLGTILGGVVLLLFRGCS